MAAVWAYDAIAEFYDDDMGRNADGRDVAYYRDACLAACRGTPGPVLELGCGTGRITLALAAAGLDVVGIDRSEPMLRVLRRKAAVWRSERRLALAAMDMAQPALGGRFAAVLCPFSALTYLVEDEGRRRALAFIRGALAPGGRFLVDAFIPDAAVEAGAEIFDYRRSLPDGTWLERRKTVTPDARPGVNRIARRYSFFAGGGGGRREIVTESLQRSYRPAQLLTTIREAGFRVLSATADFTGAAIGDGSRVTVVEAAVEQEAM